MRTLFFGFPVGDNLNLTYRVEQNILQFQHDGLITEVENFGYAWQTGLRQGSRLVEINKQPVTGSSHEQVRSPLYLGGFH